MLDTDFLLTSLVVVLIPGAGVIYTVSTGLFMGRRASVAAAVGCTAGIVPHLAASVLGLSLLLHMSALAFQVLKFAGTAYLLYLAWSMWRNTGAIEFSPSGGDRRTRRIVARGVLVNILNPKLSIFFLAFLPLFVSPHGASPLAQMLVLSAVFMAMTLVIFIVYGILAGSVSAWFVRSPTAAARLQRVFAGVFALLAARLAFSEP